ncbi:MULTISPECIES: COX15/CtaA family protein [Anaeromyxobacter]|uniref:COX15/CtaA family protein n=1 Tax=Anaeromyxobacter TaxID=161492 RepID=UPI001F59FFF7|nr:MULTISPECIES: COX15/CtaA family protein [unclassified Anaeromyxobacter]
MRSFTRFAWAVLTYNLLVVAWGAFVRATGSGAGCGKHWPMCNGQVVPRAPAVETVIEFTHRAMSGLALLLVVALVVAAVRAFPAGHPTRKAAWASLGLMILEALVGAGLVLFGWVAKDTSFARGWVMGVHLTNTFLLLGALALTADWSAQPGGMRFAGRGALAGGLWLGFASVLIAGVTGAVAALGDTLFPATSFAEGLRQELSTEAHVLLRLRVLHPFAAIATAAVLLLVARLALRLRPDARVRRAALGLIALVGAELLAGVVNLVLAAPVPLQLLHLLLADLVWVALVLLAAASLAPGRVEVPSETPAALPAGLRG